MTIKRMLSHLLFLAAACACLAGRATAERARVTTVRRVLLISVDGFHAIDLANCVAVGTCPNLAQLSSMGVTYTIASSANPSDCYQGLTAQVRGGLPPTTCIWYDDHWDRTLFPAGSKCLGTPGTEVNFAEPIDINP